MEPREKEEKRKKGTIWNEGDGMKSLSSLWSLLDPFLVQKTNETYGIGE